MEAVWKLYRVKEWCKEVQGFHMVQGIYQRVSGKVEFIWNN